MQGRATGVGTNYVLSVRTRATQGFAGVRARCEREPELLRQGPGFVLYAIMDAVVDRYFPVIEALETELERVEERIFAGAPARASIEALYTLKQKVPHRTICQPGRNRQEAMTMSADSRWGTSSAAARPLTPSLSPASRGRGEQNLGVDWNPAIAPKRKGPGTVAAPGPLYSGGV